MTDPIAAPTAYTDATLAAYLHDLAEPVASSLGWTVASYTPVIADVLVCAGVSTVTSLTVAKARHYGAVALWRRVARHTAGNFDFPKEGTTGTIKRQQVHAMAMEMLADAEREAHAAGLTFAAVIQSVCASGDPYDYDYPDS